MIQPIPRTERVYVKVKADFDTVGSVYPREIIWKDGRTFKIDSIRDFRPASLLGPGYSSGECYTVMIRGEEKYLFFERTAISDRCRLGRWWVERPYAAPPVLR